MQKYLVTMLAIVSLGSSVCLASTDYNVGLIETEIIMSTDMPKVFQARVLNGMPIQTEDNTSEPQIATLQTIAQTAPQIRTEFVLNDKKKDDAVQPIATEEKQLNRGHIDQSSDVLSSADRLNVRVSSSTPTQYNSVTSSVGNHSNSVTAMPSGLVNLSTYGLIGYGTGFFVTPDIIATNWHIVRNIDNIAIVHLGVSTQATLIAKDENNDLALLKITNLGISRKVNPLPIIDIRKVNVGERVYTVGFPDPIKLGFRPKITDGLINSVAGEQDNPNCFQISTPIQPGNSGSPLINSHGQVVGVVSKRWTTKQYQNVSYAVKSNHLVNLLLSLPEGIIIPDEPVFANSVEGSDIMLLARDAVVTIVRNRAD